MTIAPKGGVNATGRSRASNLFLTGARTRTGSILALSPESTIMSSPSYDTVPVADNLNALVALRGLLFFCCFRQAAAIQKYQSRPTRMLIPLVSSDNGTVTPRSSNGMILPALP